MLDMRTALAVITCAAIGAAAPNAAAQFDFFAPAPSYPVSFDPIGRSFCADMDGINGPDVVVAMQDTFQILVVRNDGDGGVLEFVTVSTGPAVLAVAPADWDNDGLADVLGVTAFGGGELRLFRQLSTGVWGDPETLSLPGTPSDLATGDINGDGLVDVAVVNDTGLRIDVYINDGSGGLAALTADTYISGLVTELELCDLDADGDLDMLACVPAGPAVRRWLNDGTGDLGSSIGLTVGAGAFDIVCADLSGDGRPDLATTNSIDETISIHLNNGIGGFFAASTHAVGPSPGPIVASDFDCDGRVDLAFTEYGSTINDHVSILRNDGSGNWIYVPNVIDVNVEVLDLHAAEMDGEAGTDVVSFAVHAFSEFRVHINIGSACGECVDPPPGVQAWYTGDLCLPQDLLGNHDGTFVGLPFCPAHWKVGGGALGCSSGGTYVTVPNDCDLVPGDGDYSLNAWVRTNGTGIQPVAAVGFAPGYALDVFNGQARLVLCDDTLCWNLTGTSFINDGDWHHVAFTIVRGAMSTVRLYVDGVREGTLVAAIGDIDPFAPLLLGAAPSPVPSTFLGGDIDELQVHDRALDPGEIHAIVVAGIAGQCRATCLPTGTCDEPTELEEILAGADDEFVGPGEPTSPGAELAAECAGATDFDDDPAGGSVCHTFTDVPGNTIAATLELRLRAGAAGTVCDDSISLHADGSIEGFAWSRPLGTGPVACAGVDGLLDCPWTPLRTRTFCLDLDALPADGDGTTSVLDEMVATGRLDVRVADETMVDHMRLRLLRCPCVGDVDGDGNVDSTDLVAVILAWGPCVGACPPSCPQDFNDDCVVDTVDLVALILAWGPCPE